MGVYSDPLQTDVSAAERARKQASTLLLPHLVLFSFFSFGFGFVSLLGLPYSVVPFVCLSFIFLHILSSSPFGPLPLNLRTLKRGRPLMSLCH